MNDILIKLPKSNITIEMTLSEFHDELQEIALYETDPQDWMGYLESDDHWVPDQELAY